MKIATRVAKTRHKSKMKRSEEGHWEKNFPEILFHQPQARDKWEKIFHSFNYSTKVVFIEKLYSNRHVVIIDKRRSFFDDLETEGCE
ncbi:CLUMA_CG019713, isoform A [Clunio marinus]|uniref:CLUMA_CG019713, isoform A n=1 Tax=Clunio marinus TaxID=568069 RepID=A0A1J1J531_9DIPT|nr:CLUMA_CG019713, isoform A [Clunio marinus]